MADLNSLLVRGQTRLLNKLNASEIEASGTIKAANINSANVVKSLSISGKTITVTKGDSTTTTITTQDTTYAGDDTTITLSSGKFSQKSGIVTAGSAGPTANVTGSNNTTIKVPRITVDTYGRVTTLSEYTLTNVNTDSNTDTKVTQTAVTSTDYTNWRTIPFGASNNASEGFSPTTVTDSVFTTSALTYQPSTGTLKTAIFKGGISWSAASDNVDRNVWFSHSGSSTTVGKPVYDDDFKYNPSTNTLKVGTVNSANVVKSLSISGKTITATRGDGTTYTLTTQDTNTTYPVYTKTIDKDFKTKFRTETKGNTTAGGYLAAIRNDTASVSNSPQYGSGLAWGMGDTHGYLYMNYSSAEAYIGAGNADQLSWVKGLSFSDHTHSYAGSSSAGGSATSAVKLDTATAGSATKPVYFSGGKPVACTYSVNADVPSGAKFTDTHANGFGKVTYGSTTISAGAATDTLTLAVSGGAGLTLDTSNKKVTISAPSAYSLPAATSSVRGGVKIGSNISLSSDTISVATGSASALGVVKVGSNITVSSGTISLSKTNVTNALGYTPPKRLVFQNKTVATSAWADDTTYSDFPYKASISCSGVSSSYLAEVIFGLDDVISGVFAPINETGSGVVYIWASEKPSATITIPTISCLYN